MGDNDGRCRQGEREEQSRIYSELAMGNPEILTEHIEAGNVSGQFYRLAHLVSMGHYPKDQYYRFCLSLFSRKRSFALEEFFTPGWDAQNFLFTQPFETRLEETRNLIQILFEERHIANEGIKFSFLSLLERVERWRQKSPKAALIPLLILLHSLPKLVRTSGVTPIAAKALTFRAKGLGLELLGLLSPKPQFQTWGEYRQFTLRSREIATRFDTSGDFLELDIPKALLFSGNNRIHLAASRKNFRELQFAVGLGAEVNAPNHESETPLHLAVRSGWVRGVKFLLENGAIPNARDRRGQTPLHYLARWGKSAPVGRLLLEFGGDLTLRDYDGTTPFQAIRDNKDSEIWNFFIERVTGGEFLETLDPGHSLRRLLIYDPSHYPELKKLIQKGVDFGFFGNSGSPFLFNSPSPTLLPLLLPTIDPLRKNAMGKTFLDCCRESSWGQDVSRIYRWFRVHRPDLWLEPPPPKSKSGEWDWETQFRKEAEEWPVHAFAEGKLTVKELDLKLAQGFSINQEKGTDGSPLLHALSNRGNMDSIKPLIERGANLHHRDSLGRLLLDQFFYNYFYFKTFEKIVDAVGPDFQDESGKGLLHYAISAKEIAAIALLLSRNANLKIADHEGDTPLHFAAGQQTQAIFDLFWSFYKERYPSAPVDLLNGRGESPLHVAVRANWKYPLVQMLGACYSGYFNPNHEGRTLFHLAALGHNSELFNFLLSLSPNLDLQDKNGDTALHLAAWNRHPEILRALLHPSFLRLEYPNPQIKNNAGKTPADIAREEGNLVNFEILQNFKAPTVK